MYAQSQSAKTITKNIQLFGIGGSTGRPVLFRCQQKLVINLTDHPADLQRDVVSFVGSFGFS